MAATGLQEGQVCVLSWDCHCYLLQVPHWLQRYFTMSYARWLRQGHNRPAGGPGACAELRLSLLPSKAAVIAPSIMQDGFGKATTGLQEGQVRVLSWDCQCYLL
jgi:hypothetical protein